MVSVYSVGAGTAGGIATDGEKIGRSHAVIAIDLCLPKTLNNPSGRRETCFWDATKNPPNNRATYGLLVLKPNDAEEDLEGIGSSQRIRATPKVRLNHYVDALATP